MSASEAVVKSASECLTTSSLDKFHRQVSKLSRSDCHSSAVRSATYIHGVAASVLSVLSKEVGIASLDPHFVLSDADELATQRLAFVRAVAEKEEEVRQKAAETAAALRKAEDEAAAAGTALPTCWRKGTGYGFDGGDDYWEDDYSNEATISVRDPALVAKRVAVDSHIESSLRFIIATLEPNKVETSADVLSAAFDVLSASCVVPVLASVLRQGELAYEESPALFKQVVRCTRLFARIPALAPLLGPLEKLPIRDTIASLLKSQLEDLTDAKALAADLIEDPSTDATAAAASAGSGLTDFEAYLTSTTELVVAAAGVAPAAEACDSLESKSGEESSVADVAAATVAVEEVKADEDSSSSSSSPTTEDATAVTKSLDDMLTEMEETYTKRLGSLQFGSRAMNTATTSAGGAGGGSGDAMTYRHHYASSIKSESSGSGGAGRLPRVMKELRALRRSLPLNAGSSVFLRYDKARPYVMQALITGPSGTPYDSACLMFDLYCGTTYPNNSPSINLMTTGGGTWRAGPNLYNCGKVCLSLLGTWGGSSEESWTKDSTLLQLFVSIQSLILVEEPYFNEPSCERSKGTPAGDKASRSSSNGGFEPTRVNSIQWGVVDMLRNPPKGFEDVIREHFTLKSEYLNRVADEWIADASESTKSQLEAQVLEMRKELALLHAPPKPAASDVASILPAPPLLVRASSG